MFDILLGRKFSKKCKHFVKCIKYRMQTIRKKRQAVVRYLKKDVADLVASGHDANAFGRMDALIVEINHASCYDMIEEYCGCILGHLSRMRKERECPKEAMEAVATLIFAAARLSNLPELADLRNLFSERYGTRLESCVNKEFVEKMHKKSFSKDKKLMLMQDIAKEFAVSWNIMAFEKKMLTQSTLSNEENMNPAPYAEDHTKQSHVLKGELPNGREALAIVENQGNAASNGLSEALALQKHQVQPAELLYIIPRIPNVPKISTDDANKKTRKTSTEDNLNKRFGNGSTCNDDLPHSETSGVNLFDHVGQERRSNGAVHAASRRTVDPKPPHSKAKASIDAYSKPPYVKIMVSNGKPTLKEGLMDNDRPKDASEDANHTGRTEMVQYDGTRLVTKQSKKTAIEQKGDESRDGDCDKEEEVLDKLLIYYSKQGTTNRGSVQSEEAAKEAQLERSNCGARGVSLVQKADFSTETAIKRQTEAAAVQRRVEQRSLHPPDLGNLAARVSALRTS